LYEAVAGKPVAAFSMRRKDVITTPYKPRKPCAHHGCRELTRDRYCEAHAKQYAREYEKHRRNPDTRSRYGTQWRKIRTRYIKEHPLCELCKQAGRFTAADTVHHKVKVADGGTNDTANLQALCSECHSRLHAQQKDYF
jgi:5-methylcytosine-specific restriction protein A